jgi:hypothetical protein
MTLVCVGLGVAGLSGGHCGLGSGHKLGGFH